MVDPQTLRALKDNLSESRADGSTTLREFGRMLGRAIGRQPYSRSYVHQLLHGDKPITPPVERAACVLMLSAAALDGDGLADPMPTFEGEPIEKMRAARAAGVGWQELYVGDAAVREFVDALMNRIVRSFNR